MQPGTLVRRQRAAGATNERRPHSDARIRHVFVDLVTCAFVDLVACAFVYLAAGTPVRVNGITVTPESHALIVRWRSAGFVWNRPVAVLVEREGRTERIPIWDVTRIVQIGLAGVSLACLLVVLVMSARRKEEAP